MPVPPLLTIAELRTQCRVEDSADDAALLAMAAAAEQHVEALTGQVLTRRTEIFRKFEWPASAGWELVRAPVVDVLSVAYTDPAGAAQTLPGTVWVLRRSFVPVLALRRDQRWPEIEADSEILITLDVGHDAGECPSPLKRACLMLAAFWFDNRSAVNVGNAAAEMPLAVADLIAPFKLKRVA